MKPKVQVSLLSDNARVAKMDCIALGSMEQVCEKHCETL